MRDVVLNWGVGAQFGWGLLGLNLFALWSNDKDIRPLMDQPITPADLDGLDALKRAHIAKAVRASNAALEARQRGDGLSPVEAIGVDGLGNDLNAISPLNTPTKVARAIFESIDVAGAAAKFAPYDQLLTASSWTAGWIKAASGRDAKIIHEGVDLTLFAPGPPSRWRDPDAFYVFSGGKLEYRKGQDLVLDGFRRFAARHPKAVLVTAWNSPWPQLARGMKGRLDSALSLEPDGGLGLRRWASENGLLASQFIDLGRVPNFALPQILRDMDVALQPSRAEACTNLVVKEAMACGLPTIAAWNTGMVDLLTEATAILLKHQGPVRVPPGTPFPPHPGPMLDDWGESDAEDIDAALEFAFQNRDQVRTLGLSARRDLEARKRSWSDHADALKTWLLDDAVAL